MDVATSLKVVYLVLYSLVFVLGVLGNGVVIWVTGFKMKKTVSTVWYLNLAVADFFVTAILPITLTEAALDFHWPFGQFMCKLDAIVFYLNMHASIYILVVISVDRCIIVACPVWVRNHRSVRKACWVSLGVWVLAFAVSSPYMSYRDTEDSNYNDDVWCWDIFPRFNGTTEEYQSWERGHVAMIFTRLLMGFVVPLTVIVSCYSVAIYHLKHNHSLQSGRPLKIMAAVVASFFLCWAPFHIIHLINAVNVLVSSEFSQTLYQVVYYGIAMASALALFNSCLNPLLYVFMGQDFKDVMKDVFSKSVLKVVERAFADELPEATTSTNPGSTVQISLSETQGCL